MKKIEAIIRPQTLDKVKQGLATVGIHGMTITDALGLGRQSGYTEMYRGIEHRIEFLSKIKLELVVDEQQLDTAISVIMECCRTGQIGDGKIFISTIERVLRIRTAEENMDAM